MRPDASCSRRSGRSGVEGDSVGPDGGLPEIRLPRRLIVGDAVSSAIDDSTARAPMLRPRVKAAELSMAITASPRRARPCGARRRRRTPAIDGARQWRRRPAGPGRVTRRLAAAIRRAAEPALNERQCRASSRVRLPVRKAPGRPTNSRVDVMVSPDWHRVEQVFVQRSRSVGRSRTCGSGHGTDLVADNARSRRSPGWSTWPRWRPSTWSKPVA